MYISAKNKRRAEFFQGEGSIYPRENEEHLRKGLLLCLGWREKRKTKQYILGLYLNTKVRNKRGKIIKYE